MIDRQRKEDLCRYARDLHARGWVANHDGNISVRDDDGRFVATPTGWSKRLVQPDDLVVIDRAGKVLRGKRRIFSEWRLHRAVYDARPDVQVVLHAHPPTACGFALAGRDLGPVAAAEVVVSLGPRIPTVSFALPGSEALDADVARTAARYDAFVLARHGVITCGTDLEQAYLRMELVEHYAQQVLIARQLGGERPLDDEQIQKLLDARARAGLGPESRGLSRHPY